MMVKRFLCPFSKNSQWGVPASQTFFVRCIWSKSCHFNCFDRNRLLIAGSSVKEQSVFTVVDDIWSTRLYCGPRSKRIPGASRRPRSSRSSRLFLLLLFLLLLSSYSSFFSFRSHASSYFCSFISRRHGSFCTSAETANVESTNKRSRCSLFQRIALILLEYNLMD